MALEKFHFTTSEGVEITVPYFKDAVLRKEMRKVQKLAKEAGGFENLDDDVLYEAAKLDQATIDALDEMTLRDYEDFNAQWTEASKTGKSSAS